LSLHLRTPRLSLDALGPADAPFLVELLNDPAFLRYIGDKGVRDEAGARQYLANGPQASYAEHGFGLLRVALREGGTPIGICGLLKRETLEHPDLGFAFLPAWCKSGYGFESATAVLADARAVEDVGRVLAITTPDNAPSIALLQKLGFVLEDERSLAPDGPVLKVFASEP
jgi:ribosomal-protein-alanine N-acetyltransferase